MDNILDKIGLYDLFGLLLPGVFFTAILYLIDFPLVNSLTYFDSEVLEGVVFILVSYICGTIMQEIASFIDDNIIKMRDNAIKEILSDEKLSESELEKIKNIVKNLSQKGKKHYPTRAECYDAFFQCKEYLEDKGKMKKADKLDAIFAMSRDFVVCNLLLSICIIASNIVNIINVTSTNIWNWLIIIPIIASIFIFNYRAKRYAKMRVRSIFRRYMSCKKKNSK